MDKMMREQHAWLGVHAMSIRKLKSHIERWLRMQEGTTGSKDDDPSCLKQDKRETSTWLHSVIARGHQLEKKLADYLLQHDLCNSLPSHRGCDCHFPVTDKDRIRQPIAEHLKKKETQVHRESPTPQPNTSAQSRDPQKLITPCEQQDTVDGTVAADDINSAFSIDGHYDDFYINGIQEKKAQVEVCTRKHKRWQMAPEDQHDVRRSKKQGCHKKTGGVRGRERPERGDGSSPGPGRRTKHRLKGKAGNRNKRAKAAREERKRTKSLS